MADFGLGTFSTTARTLVGSESGFLDRDGTLHVTGSDAISATFGTNWVSNHGFIYAYGGGFAAIDADGGVFELLNGKDGVIDAENPTGGTIDLNLSTFAQLVNHGTIHSANSDAIEFSDSDGGATFHLINTGEITANDTTALDLNVGTGTFRIDNSGLISSSGATIDVDQDIGGIGNHILINSGHIVGSGDDGANFAIGTSGGLQIANSGTITGWSEAIQSTRDNIVRILNTGILESIGTDIAVNIEGGTDVIRNAGHILGDVYMGGGTDLFEGTGGVVNGTVYGESGNDTLAGGEEADKLDGGGDDDKLVGRGGDDYLNGGSGSDVILGGAGNDEIDGGTNSDTLNGNSGDDTIFGNLDSDLLVGQDGSDFLDGGNQDDLLDGGNGDDTLEGGDGNDILRGRAGEDDLAGGLGRDLLTGGEGADNFVFRSIAGTVAGANRDQIMDFEQGVDTIVIAGLSPGVFEFRGTAAFAPSGNPEIRLNETATGSTIVQIDNNGDGTIDAEIRVGGVTGLTADDFVL
ncbi:leukotoxin [Antarctobacter heliothermus]|uniref:Leukotoxin n=1 Tax=Antarctobacter heliothermus TaxID=74033 RepID=A0A222E8R2_9RHOB|nr:calcium-binding protein [Antarctobacter heliothermus]ASP22603.1 leukotoxin [Antarctobacter heliothermus]